MLRFCHEKCPNLRLKLDQEPFTRNIKRYFRKKVLLIIHHISLGLQMSFLPLLLIWKNEEHQDKKLIFFSKKTWMRSLMILLVVVSSIRKAMSKQNNEFTGQFLKGCQEKSVPKELLTLISMLVDGTNPNSKLSQFSLTCAQLIMSYYKPNNKTNEEKMTYHSRKREMPIVVYNALNLYGRFRSKGIITDMFHLGLCAPYLTALGITKNIAENMIKEFEKLSCFVPRSTRRGIFTVIAKDNIDLNSRSYTATSHYHGTSMSLIQFSGEVKGTEYELSFPMDEKIMSFKISPLPEKYAKVNTYISDIPEYYAPKNNGPIPTLDLSILEIAVQHEFFQVAFYIHSRKAWLGITPLSSQKRFPLRKKDFTAVLLLLWGKVHTLSM